MTKFVYRIVLSNGKNHSRVFHLETDLVSALPAGTRVDLGGTELAEVGGSVFHNLRIRTFIHWLRKREDGSMSDAVAMLLSAEEGKAVIDAKDYPKTARLLRNFGWTEMQN